MQKYNWCSLDEEMQKNENGEYYKVEDVEDIQWLFDEKLQMQINKLQLQNGDILVVKLPKKNWSMEQGAVFRNTFMKVLEKSGLNNHCIFCNNDINFGVISGERKKE